MGTDSRRPQPPRLASPLDSEAEVELGPGFDREGLVISGDFSGVSAADGRITGSRLAQAQLTGAGLERVHVMDCVFVGCEMSGAVLDEAVLTRVEFTECRLSGLVATRAKMTDVRFEDCRLDGANLAMAVGERVELVSCDLHEAEFYEAHFTDARFATCDLTGADLSRAELRGARLQGSRLDDLKGGRALEGAVIDSSQVVSVALGLMRALDILVDDELDDEPDD